MEQQQDDMTLGVMYASLLVRLKNIIFNPAGEWRKIRAENNDTSQVLSVFALPMIGLCTLAAFLMVLIRLPEIDYAVALKQAMITFTALYGGMYLAYLATNFMLPWFGVTATKQENFSTIAYSMSPFFVITFMVILFPDLTWLYLASACSLYIIWHAVKGFEGIEPGSALTIGAIIAVLIHILPFFVQQLLKVLFFKI